MFFIICLLILTQRHAQEHVRLLCYGKGKIKNSTFHTESSEVMSSGPIREFLNIYT